MSVKTLATLTSLATGAAIAFSAGTAQAFTKNGVTGIIMGYECPTTTCVDLATGGYTVSGGALLDPAVSITNVTKTPGTDVKGPDTVNDSGKVTSYNVTSRIDNPDGAADPIVVTDLLGAFDFFWGSVDTYNVLEFFDGTNLVATFTGADIATAAGVTGSGNLGFDAYVGFTGAFDSAKLRSSGVAFEVATASVPEPTSLLGLAAVGLVAGGSLMKRKGQSA